MLSGLSLLDKINIIDLHAPVAAGTSDITDCAQIDMANWDCVLILVRFGAITAGAVTDVTIQGSNTSGSGFGTLVDDSGNNVVKTVLDTYDNKWVAMDIIRPRNRYLLTYINRATQNAAVDAVLAIQYNGRDLPVSQSSTNVSTYSRYNSPVYGDPDA
jgi:hypothetical protein